MSAPKTEREARTRGQVLELVDLSGLTPREAASVLGLSPNLVRVRLFRARHRLRKEVEDELV